jgi:ParB-like chromosome segregation protein Spo0J
MTKTVMTLEPHPLARTFPPMEVEDFNKLKHDIRENGQREPIVLHEGKILDGVHRYNACCDLGMTPTTKSYTGKDPLGFVISMNIHRRHLTAEKKREIITELLQANPQLSDRAIATQAKVSPTTVGEVRKTTVQTGQSETRTGLDGKKRKASPRKKGVISPGKRMKQVEAFKETWDSFDGWQQRAFVKTYKDQLTELLQEVENEDSASVEVSELEVA